MSQIKRINIKNILFAILIFTLIILIGYKLCLKKTVVSQFTTEELLEDFDYMWNFLEQEYLFFPVLEEQGIDIDNIKNNTREQITAQRPDIELFYDTLDQMFLQMDYFAHLSLVNINQYKVYQEYYNSEDSLETGWKDVLQKEQTVFIYEEILSKRKVIEQDASYPEIEITYYEKQKAVVFHIKSFDSALISRDENFISKYLETMEGVPIEHIVFDITGNPGGNDLYWRENIVKVFGGEYTWTTQLYLRDTEWTKSYFGNLDYHLIENDVNEDEYPAFTKQLNTPCFITIEDEICGTAQLKQEFLNAQRWVLIDNRVYSAADSFATFCKATGWATLVGNATKGDGIGTTPFIIALPNTGLLVRFSGTASANAEGCLNALYGTSPDYYSQRWESPVNTLWELIGIE